ncbi:ABC transporter permease [Pectinatus sottacetonis]|uniref:ABC transporter permease n=1 Tax=Pectinatus sottacetonis TaxID=1002795 RepID=UPI0018C58812|nr:ABC transporter permease subunit [Pectinatus sottacetonis]
MFTQTLVERKFTAMDIVVLAVVFMIFYIVLKLSMGMDIPFSLDTDISISLSPEMLPYYAGRSLLRMFIALGFSFLFTFIYGYIAARSKWAGKIMIPLLDILQSIPVLGFLSATIVAFMTIFPNTLLGVECASIFAIFTGQAWNMTFSFYHSLTTLPKDLEEASQMLHFNKWQKFTKLELPVSMIGLIWNAMMSFGGGWFFLAASEAISVLGKDIHLPGIGSYLAVAAASGNIRAMVYAMLTMLIMILLVDQVFWRPLVVWGQRFKLESSKGNEQPTSFVYNLLYRSFIVFWIYRKIFMPIGRFINKKIVKTSDRIENSLDIYKKIKVSAFFQAIIKIFILAAFLYEIYIPVKDAVYMLYEMGFDQLWHVFNLGLLTAARVFMAILLGAIWTIPAGVKIGMQPKLSQKIQPLVQAASSFPANMLFPFITMLFIQYGINFQYGSIVLMMLGTQWYILFNVIAGAASIPNDLVEAAAVLGIKGWKKWRVLILPAIFPYLVTGFITASGGAWNASIISEIVKWKQIVLTASGIGAYISMATTLGDWSKILLGIIVMCIMVVVINRFIWHRLYYIAQTKYHVD